MIDHPVLSDRQRTPAKAVAEAARKGLDLREQHGRGGDDARDWIDGLRPTLREVGV